jgi:hypothetical protein
MKGSKLNQLNPCSTIPIPLGSCSGFMVLDPLSCRLRHPPAPSDRNSGNQGPGPQEKDSREDWQMRIISQFFQRYSQKPETNQLQSEGCADLKPPKQAPVGSEKKAPKQENQKTEIEENPRKHPKK